MSRLVLLRGSDYRRVRWKNDGGWTTEIARDPADDALDFRAYLQPEWQPGEDSRGLAPDVAGAHEKAMARDLRVDRILAKSANKKLGKSCGHALNPSDGPAWRLPAADSGTRQCDIRPTPPFRNSCCFLVLTLRGRRTMRAVWP